METQNKIAKHVIDLLTSSELFDTVVLTGSVSNGEFDDFSDIDILVSCQKRSSAENVELASAVIEAEYGVNLRGWSPSLLPDKYLISHFLPKVPIFWWLDIGCMPNARFQALSRDDIKQDENTHIAKLWVMNAKHMLRGTKDRLQIRALFSKVFGVHVEFPGEVIAFQQILEHIDFSTIDTAFHKACLQVMAQIELYQLH